MRKKFVIGMGSVVLALGIAGALTSAALASSSSLHVTSVALSGTLSAPVITITGTGLGAAPTNGKQSGLLVNCGNGSWNGSDWTGAKLWFADANPADTWGAGNLTDATHGTCVGINITSWTATKAVLTFGTAYGSFGWVLHDSDPFVIALKTQPVIGVVPAGF